MFSRRVMRPLLQSTLLLAPVPAMLVAALAVPAAAQGHRVAPHSTVMGVRLLGVWQDSTTRYYFKRLEDGTVEYQQARQDGERWVLSAKGILENAPSKGAMVGMVYPVNGANPWELKAWIADDGRLWMNGRNAEGDRFFDRVSRTATPPDVVKSWVGRWRTSRGILDIQADNGNLFGWLTRDGEKHKERVAIRAEGRSGRGGWDSEYDERGEWLHKPVRWGDMTLLLSEDGKSFTGMFSSTRSDAVGLYEQSWSGERFEASPADRPEAMPGPPTVDLLRLTGNWQSSWGTVTFTAGQPSLYGPRLRGVARPNGGRQLAFHIWNNGGQLAGEGLVYGQDDKGQFTARLIDGQMLEITTGHGFGRSSKMLALTRGTDDFTWKHPAGQWETTLGKLELRGEGSHLTGTIVPEQGGSEGRMLLAVHHYDEQSRTIPGLAGAWQAAVVGVEGAGLIRMDLMPDGSTFTGSYTRMVGGQAVEQSWSGRKVASADDSAPSGPPERTPAPAPRPAPTPRVPVPAPTPTPDHAEASAAGFQPLGKWDVRLDRVENPRDDRLTHVYLTLRNPETGTHDLLQTEDVWVYLEAGGIEQRSGQGLRAEPGYPKLFGSPPPVVRPGRELRTKFVFDRQTGGGPIVVTVEEGGHEAVYEF